MNRQLFLALFIAISLMLSVGCANDDDDGADDDYSVIDDDESPDDDQADDDVADDDIADDDAADDDQIDDDLIDDDMVDDDLVDDDVIDDDVVNDDVIDDDTVDDDIADDDTVAPMEMDYFAIGHAELEPSVQPLLDLRQAQGMSVWYVDTETIGAGGDDPDLPARIRSYLQSMVDPERLQYVLLVGSHAELPMRVVDPDPLYPGQYDCLTDVYYGELSGDFDADGDGVYGEYGEDVYDWEMEMYVGRLPFDDPLILASVAERIVDFQTADPDHKWEALLAAGTISITGDSSLIMEMINDGIVTPAGFNSYRMYEFPGFILPNQWLTHNGFMNRMTTQPPGFAMWACHGSSTCAYAGEAFVCADDVVEFSPDDPVVAFSSACSNGNIEHPDCLGTSILAHNGVAFAGSTAVTHPGVIGEASLIFMVMVDHTLVKNTPLSEGMADSKLRYMDIYFPLAWYEAGLYLRNFFGFNLLGDPALTYWHEAPQI